MLTLQVKRRGQSPLQILCLGAHSDDIEIGCGGTLLKLIEDFRRNIAVHWVVFSATAEREREARKSAGRFLKQVRTKTLIIHHFRDTFFPFVGTEIKEAMQQLSKQVRPDLIFTHYRNDLHQDHRLISELTWNAFRDHLILEYEIPKYDGDLGAPNIFVHLERSVCEKKTKLILDCFKSQADKQWFTKETFFALLRLRGVESNAPSRYAEGFHCRKLVLN